MDVSFKDWFEISLWITKQIDAMARTIGKNMLLWFSRGKRVIPILYQSEGFMDVVPFEQNHERRFR